MREIIKNIPREDDVNINNKKSAISRRSGVAR